MFYYIKDMVINLKAKIYLISLILRSLYFQSFTKFVFIDRNLFYRNHWCENQDLLISLFDCLFIRSKFSDCWTEQKYFSMRFYTKQQCRVNLRDTFFPLYDT